MERNLPLAATTGALLLLLTVCQAGPGEPLTILSPRPNDVLLRPTVLLHLALSPEAHQGIHRGWLELCLSAGPVVKRRGYGNAEDTDPDIGDGRTGGGGPGNGRGDADDDDDDSNDYNDNDHDNGIDIDEGETKRSCVSPGESSASAEDTYPGPRWALFQLPLPRDREGPHRVAVTLRERAPAHSANRPNYMPEKLPSTSSATVTVEHCANTNGVISSRARCALQWLSEQARRALGQALGLTHEDMVQHHEDRRARDHLSAGISAGLWSPNVSYLVPSSPPPLPPDHEPPARGPPVGKGPGDGEALTSQQAANISSTTITKEDEDVNLAGPAEPAPVPAFDIHLPKKMLGLPGTDLLTLSADALPHEAVQAFVDSHAVYTVKTAESLLSRTLAILLAHGAEPDTREMPIEKQHGHDGQRARPQPRSQCKGDNVTSRQCVFTNYAMCAADDHLVVYESRHDLLAEGNGAQGSAGAPLLRSAHHLALPMPESPIDGTMPARWLAVVPQAGRPPAGADHLDERVLVVYRDRPFDMWSALVDVGMGVMDTLLALGWLGGDGFAGVIHGEDEERVRSLGSDTGKSAAPPVSVLIIDQGGRSRFDGVLEAIVSAFSPSAVADGGRIGSSQDGRQGPRIRPVIRHLNGDDGFRKTRGGRAAAAGGGGGGETKLTCFREARIGLNSRLAYLADASKLHGQHGHPTVFLTKAEREDSSDGAEFDRAYVWPRAAIAAFQRRALLPLIMNPRLDRGGKTNKPRLRHVLLVSRRRHEPNRWDGPTPRLILNEGDLWDGLREEVMVSKRLVLSQMSLAEQITVCQDEAAAAVMMLGGATAMALFMQPGTVLVTLQPWGLHTHTDRYLADRLGEAAGLYTATWRNRHLAQTSFPVASRRRSKNATEAWIDANGKDMNENHEKEEGEEAGGEELDGQDGQDGPKEEEQEEDHFRRRTHACPRHRDRACSDFFLNQDTVVDVAEVRRLLRVSIVEAGRRPGAPFDADDVLRLRDEANAGAQGAMTTEAARTHTEQHQHQHQHQHEPLSQGETGEAQSGSNAAVPPIVASAAFDADAFLESSKV